LEERTGILSSIQSLLRSQTLAVLATDRKGHPYSSLVAFVASEDLSSIYFATSRTTRKFENLLLNQQVSLLVDSRSNHTSDFREAEAVTILGEAREVQETEKAACETLYLTRHPQLEAFVRAPTSALVRVHVSTYYHVTRFQNVRTFRPGALDM